MKFRNKFFVACMAILFCASSASALSPRKQEVINAPWIFEQGVTNNGALTQAGATTLSGANTLSGATTISGTTTLSGATTVSGASTVSGLMTHTGGTLALNEDVTAANVLTAAECGKTMFLNSATEFQTTLPAISTVSAGCEFKFIVKAAPAAASYTVITANSLENVVTGGVVERETDTGDDGPYQAAGDTITFVDGVAVAGDYIELISDGTLFYMTGQVNADGGLTIAQAD